MIPPIRKLTLVALRRDKKKVLDAVAKSGCCEIADCYPFAHTRAETGNAETAEELARVAVAMRFFEEQRSLYEQAHPKNRRQKPLFACRREVRYADFAKFAKKLPALFALVETLEGLHRRREQLLEERSACAREREELAPFACFPEPLSHLTGTAHTALFLVQLNRLPDLPEGCEKRQLADAAMEEVWLVACPRSNRGPVEEALLAAGGRLCAVRGSLPAAERVGACALREAEIAAELDALAACVACSDAMLLEQGYDALAARQEREELAGRFRYTEEAFVLSGWVPEPAEETLRECVTAVSPSASLRFSLPEEGDEPPTVTRNGRLVSAFEAVTNMYSVPSPYERDPNLFVMIFFLIFFGIMLSDAGYGIILAVGAFLLLRFAKPDTGMKRMILVLGLGGLSTVLWGTLFGGWFGITLSPDSPSGIVRFLNRLKWFGPLEQPLWMLGLCMGLGVVQILFGMGIRMVDLWKAGTRLDAVLDVGTWYLFFAGVGLWGVSLLPAAAACGPVGKWVMLAALLLLVATQGRRERGIFKKIGKGLASLYGLVGYLSDVLSYARLFGLGLATGVIALVMNTLAVMLFANPWTALLGVAVAAGGHIFNLAINVLGAYVHDCRLQYIEFFSRFYTGGGRTFCPMLEGLRYHKIVG